MKSPIRTAIVLLLAFFIFANNEAKPQFRLENWKSYTSMLDTRAASVDSRGRIWAATSGGVYNYDPATGEIDEFRNIDAMLTLDATSIKCNPETKAIYIGAFDGTLEIVSEDYVWCHQLEIKNAGFYNPIITDIAFKDSLVFIAGGFGLTVFNHNEKVFKEDVR